MNNNNENFFPYCFFFLHFVNITQHLQYFYHKCMYSIVYIIYNINIFYNKPNSHNKITRSYVYVVYIMHMYNVYV